MDEFTKARIDKRIATANERAEKWEEDMPVDLVVLMGGLEMGEGELEWYLEFDNLSQIMQLDLLRDWIYELQTKYNSVLDSEQVERSDG